MFWFVCLFSSFVLWEAKVGKNSLGASKEVVVVSNEVEEETSQEQDG